MQLALFSQICPCSDAFVAQHVLRKYRIFALNPCHESFPLSCFILLIAETWNSKQIIQKIHPRWELSHPMLFSHFYAILFAWWGGAAFGSSSRSLRPLTNFGILGKTEDVFEQYWHDVWWCWFFDWHLTLALSSPIIWFFRQGSVCCAAALLALLRLGIETVIRVAWSDFRLRSQRRSIFLQEGCLIDDFFPVVRWILWELIERIVFPLQSVFCFLACVWIQRIKKLWMA